MSDAADALGDLLDNLPEAAGAAGAAAAELAAILARMSTATEDANGRLRDARGRFISAGDQAKVAAAGITDAADALAGLGPAGDTGAAGLKKTDDALKKLGEWGQPPPVADYLKDVGDKALDMTGKTDGAAHTVDDLSSVTGELTSELTQNEGVLGSVTDALKSFGPEGEAAAIVLTAIVAVATVLISTLWDLVTGAIAISQEKDALASTFEALSDGAESGMELVDSLSAVAAELPQAEGKVLAWGKTLLAAGVQGKALEESLRAVASAEALMGSEGAGAATTMLKMLGEGGKVADMMIKQIQEGGPKAARMLAEMGLHAKDIAKALDTTPEAMKTMKLTAEQAGAAVRKALVEKGADALEEMSLTWESIMGKLDDAWGDLFEDMGTAIKPFMREVRDLFAEFSAGGVAQSATKSLLTSFFTELFEIAAKVTHAIHLGYLEIEVAALKAYIAMAPIVKALKMILASAVTLTVLKFAFYGIVAIVVVFAALIAFSTAIILLFAAAFASVIGIVIALVSLVVSAISYLIDAIIDLVSSTGGALSGWASDAYDAAADWVSGIVNGISSGTGAVVAAVTALASAALDTFTSFFAIKSPSRVMAKMGGHIAQGTAEGIDDGADEAQGSMEDMLTPKGGKGGASGGSSDSKGGVTFTNCTFGGDLTEGTMREWWVRILAMTAGEGPTPETA